MLNVNEHKKLENMWKWDECKQAKTEKLKIMKSVRKVLKYEK